MGQKDYPAAVSHCQDSIAIFPKQSGLSTIRGVALMQLGSRGSALAAFEQAILVDQNDSSAWYNRACLRVKQGQLEEAIVDLRQALELRPELAQTAINDSSSLSASVIGTALVGNR